MDHAAERDENLMAQVAFGRTDPLEVLVRRHATALLTFLARMIGDRHRAEELFQEVFLTVWLKREQYQFPRPFRPWLYTIALNRCRALFRLKSPIPVALPGDVTDPATDDSPEEQAISAETAELVSAAVTRLPPQQRAVVVLRVWQGLPYGRIAEIVDCSEGTVRSHMHHALASLRTTLEPLVGSRALS